MGWPPIVHPSRATTEERARDAGAPSSALQQRQCPEHRPHDPGIREHEADHRTGISPCSRPCPCPRPHCRCASARAPCCAPTCSTNTVCSVCASCALAGACAYSTCTDWLSCHRPRCRPSCASNFNAHAPLACTSIRPSSAFCPYASTSAYAYANSHLKCSGRW
jgi:hypothetical protein